jgi:predicted phosphodiesterase
MRILVISDIHGNIVALDSVLEHAGEVDSVWCLGDVVGYGPNPNECIKRLLELPNIVCILGNHDAAAIDKLDLTTFNPEARLSMHWLQSVLTPESIEFLENLPEDTVIEQVSLAHGSPRFPVFEYLLDTFAATENFRYFQTDFCFVGHTHLPSRFSMNGDDYMANLSIPTPDNVYNLLPRSIVNPGSVGQPRDRDPRSSYAIFNPAERTWLIHRVEYDIANVQERMVAVELPERHITRLKSGW